jgi:hypothetical protein
MVHPHPGATSTNSYSILSSTNRLQAQYRRNPYFAQDRRSVQPSRSFFLAFNHKDFYIFTQGLALSYASLYKMHKSLDHTDPFLALSLYHIDTIQSLSLSTTCLYVYLYIQNGPKHGQTHEPTSLSHYIFPKLKKGPESRLRSLDLCFVWCSILDKLSKSQK